LLVTLAAHQPRTEWHRAELAALIECQPATVSKHSKTLVTVGVLAVTPRGPAPASYELLPGPIESLEGVPQTVVMSPVRRLSLISRAMGLLIGLVMGTTPIRIGRRQPLYDRLGRVDRSMTIEAPAPIARRSRNKATTKRSIERSEPVIERLSERQTVEDQSIERRASTQQRTWDFESLDDNPSIARCELPPLVEQSTERAESSDLPPVETVSDLKSDSHTDLKVRPSEGSDRNTENSSRENWWHHSITKPALKQASTITAMIRDATAAGIITSSEVDRQQFVQWCSYCSRLKYSEIGGLFVKGLQQPDKYGKTWRAKCSTKIDEAAMKAVWPDVLAALEGVPAAVSVEVRETVQPSWQAEAVAESQPLAGWQLEQARKQQVAALAALAEKLGV
jgi:hypothetical protein